MKLVDTNLLEGTIKEILLDDKLKVYVFDVFDDSVLKYTISNGKLTNCGSDTLANYLENINKNRFSLYTWIYELGFYSKNEGKSVVWKFKGNV